MIDLYGQREIMGEATWNFTIVMTVVISIINIMLINNLFDKGFLLIELIASFLFYFIETRSNRNRNAS